MEEGVSVVNIRGQRAEGRGKERRCMCRLDGGHLSSICALRTSGCLPPHSRAGPHRPQNGARYLRVVLGEEVGPVRRRGDAYDEYSLDGEEAENAARLRADRHFP